MVAKAKKTPAKKSSSTTKVTRITAQDSTPVAADEVKETKVKAEKKPVIESGEKRRNPFRATADYFKGAWYELRQVRWPNRRATWGMTVALLAFTAFFVVLILLLDALFKYVFQLILG